MNESTDGKASPDAEDANGLSDACRLARHATKAALATHDEEFGAPLASLVSIAFNQSGAPLLLLSDLARHSSNIATNGRVSVLFDRTGDQSDPLEGPRITYIGTAKITANEADRQRFLARHPEAAGYAGFSDFKMYAVSVDHVHFVNGFGRIFTVAADPVLVPGETARAFAGAEASIVDHMNKDHADAVALLGGKLPAASRGRWQLCGCDADGFDLHNGAQGARRDFPRRLNDPAATRVTFKSMTDAARRSGPS